MLMIHLWGCLPQLEDVLARVKAEAGWDLEAPFRAFTEGRRIPLGEVLSPQGTPIDHMYIQIVVS
jgi:hypothetical protein